VKGADLAAVAAAQVEAEDRRAEAEVVQAAVVGRRVEEVGAADVQVVQGAVQAAVGAAAVAPVVRVVQVAAAAAVGRRGGRAVVRARAEDKAVAAVRRVAAAVVAGGVGEAAVKAEVVVRRAGRAVRVAVAAWGAVDRVAVDRVAVAEGVNDSNDGYCVPILLERVGTSSFLYTPCLARFPRFCL
jgi:hypothetical protein